MPNHHTSQDERSKELLKLSDAFESLEGRRPRLMIVALDQQAKKEINGISSGFADAGFDVDIAPSYTDATNLYNLATDSDLHILFLLSSGQDQKTDQAVVDHHWNTFRESDIFLVYKTNSKSIANLQSPGAQLLICENMSQVYDLIASLLSNMLQ